jgi:cephalosporin hydroxylase
VNRPLLFIEIGCGEGGSLQLWKQYFGPLASIVGIDIRPECKAYEEDQISVQIGDQTDARFLKSVIDRFGSPHVVLDDGSHMMEHIAASFDFLYPHVAADGVYMVEDLHTAYWNEYNGGLQRPGTFIEACKNLVDELNADHTRGAIVPTLFSKTTLSMHFYDSIVVFERGSYGRKYAPMMGKPADAAISLTKPVTAVTATSKSSSSTGLLSKSRYTDLLIKILANVIYKDPSRDPMHDASFDETRRSQGQDWPLTAHSMAGLARLTNLRDLTQAVLDENVPGDFIETGVWRGGCCILMRGVLAANGVVDRKVYVADSFKGLPPPKEEFEADRNDILHTFHELAISKEQVANNFRLYDLLDDQVVFLEGLFQDTLRVLGETKFALLRLDGDMYESTIIALQQLYPRLSPGGFVIIDDYGAIPACKAAVTDYRMRLGIDEPIHEIDWTGVWWRKPFVG